MTRYGFVLWTSARQQWVYRAELGMRAIQIVLFIGVFMALWTTVFGISGQAELEGYSLVEMVWYLAMTETIALSTSRVFVEISEAVKAGGLAYTLARPLSYPFYQVANSLGNSVPRFVLNLLTAGTVGGFHSPVFSGLAWALIFGLLASTAFTLVVVPVVYFIIYDKGDGQPAV